MASLTTLASLSNNLLVIQLVPLKVIADVEELNKPPLSTVTQDDKASIASNLTIGQHQQADDDAPDVPNDSPKDVQDLFNSSRSNK